MATTRTPGITVLADSRRFIDKRYLGVRIGLRVGAVTQEQAEARLQIEIARVQCDHAQPKADTPSQRRPSILGKALLLSNLDDDFPFCTSLFDVSHCLFGRFKWEDPVQDWAYGARLDERTDLSQLIPACSHEEKGIVDLMTLGLSSDPEA